MAETATHETTSASIVDRLRALGPALVLAAVVVGPGSIALSTIAGGTYGYSLLWVPVAATIFMITYVWMAARIGLVTGDTIFEATRVKYGDTVAKAAGIFGFLTILAFQAGNNAGIGFASEALFGILDPEIWAILFTLLAMGFLWLPSLYDKVEGLVKVVVGIMLVAFVGTLAIVGIDFGSAAQGLAPTFPDSDAVLTSLGLAATNFSIAAAVYQSHLMKEKEWGPDRLTEQGFDSLVGIAILGLIVMVILLTSAAVIGTGEGEPAFSATGMAEHRLAAVIGTGEGEPAFSATGMAEQLEPLAGQGAFYLFTIGFFFAALSSLVVNALIGATLLVDGFGGDASMDSNQVKYWAMGAMALGTISILVTGGSGDPVELLRFAQAMAVVAFPLLAFLVLSIARDRDLMGQYANPTAVDVLGVIGYLAVIGIVINYLNEVLAHFGYGIF